MTRIYKTLTVLALIFFSTATLADLEVKFIKEASLSYDYSPSNHDNSPSNYDNSISNYDNSPSNYENSESNYSNSSSNYENSANGKNRLIQNGKYVGYYITPTSGTTNFYSPSGKRIFYNPKKSQALFTGSAGAFSGVIANVNDQPTIVLTEIGAKQLLMSR